VFPIASRRCFWFIGVMILVSTAMLPAAGAGAAPPRGHRAPSARVPDGRGATSTTTGAAIETVSYREGVGPWQTQTVTIEGLDGSYRLQHGEAVTEPLAPWAPACQAPAAAEATDAGCTTDSVQTALSAVGIDAQVAGGPDGIDVAPMVRYTITFADANPAPLTPVHVNLSPEPSNVTVDCVFCADTEASPPIDPNGAAIVYAHGGGFVGGDRTDDAWAAARTRFEAAGYRTYAINYRLLNPSADMWAPDPFGARCDWRAPVETEICDAWLRASDDAAADVSEAVAWVKSQGPAVGIDPSRVAVLGASAGAIAALNNHYAASDPAGSPAATVSMAGIMDTDRQVGPAGPVLLFAFAGVDPPYAGKFLVGIDAQQRNEDVLARATALGNKAFLRTYPGIGHEISDASPYFDDVMATTLAFLAEQLRSAAPASSMGGTWFGAGNAFRVGTGQSPGSAPGDAAKAIPGDFNGDGAADVLWQSPTAGHDMVWFGDVDGVLRDPVEWQGHADTYTPAVNTPAGRQSVVADFDGDGTDDLLWYDGDTGTGTQLWRGARAGVTPAFAVAEVGTLPAGSTVVAADVDGDGRSELVVHAPSSGIAAVARLDTEGLELVDTHGALAEQARPVVGDFNGDGAEDVYWSGQLDQALWLGTVASAASAESANAASPLVRPVEAPYLASTLDAVTGDFDGDGATDIGWYDAATGLDTQIWHGAVDATFAVHVIGAFPSGLLWVTTDANADGHSDLVVSWPAYHGAALFLGAGRLQFVFTFVTTDLPVAAVPVPGDFDGDGRGDILWHA